MKNTRWQLLFFSLLWSPLGIAQWYQAQGQAVIVNDDREQAHQHAVRDAVKQALLFAGASVSSLSQIDSGILTRDQLSVEAKGEIQDLQVLDQHIEGTRLTVTINVDVVAAKNQCQASRYAKSVLVTRFQLSNREQAVSGGLFQLGSRVAERLHNELSRQPERFDTRNWLDLNLAIAPESSDPQNRTRMQMKGLARQHDSQFVIAGRIDDISLSGHTAGGLLGWFKPKTRMFDADIWLFNGITGDTVSRWSYRISADWEYAPGEQVDLAGAGFWNKQYGQAIQQVIEQAHTDLEQALECQPLQGWVIRTDFPDLQINLGARNGLQPDEHLTIWHDAAYIDQDGHVRNHMQASDSRFKVSALFPHHAQLEPLDPYPYVSVQLHDIVLPLPTDPADLTVSTHQ